MGGEELLGINKVDFVFPKVDLAFDGIILKFHEENMPQPGNGSSRGSFAVSLVFPFAYGDR